MPINGIAISQTVNEASRRTIRAGLWLITSVLLLTLSSADLNAQGRILDSATLTNQTRELSIAPYTIVQMDPHQRITPDTIRSSKGKVLSGKIARGKHIFLGYNGTPAWFSIKLTDKSDGGDWLLDLGRRGDGRMGRLSQLAAYTLEVIPDGTGGVGAIALKELPASENHGVFKITTVRNEQKLILLHLRPMPGVPSVIPLKLYSESAYLEHVTSRAIMNTIYCLVLAGFGIFLISFTFMRKMKSHIVFGVYFIYAACCWIFYDYMGSATNQEHIAGILLAMVTIYSVLSVYCTKIYCGIEHGSFAEKYILYGLMWINVIAAILTIFLPVDIGSSYLFIIYGPALLTLVMLTLMTLAQAHNGQLPGMQYCISWLFPLAGMAISLCASLGILSSNTLFLNAFWLALPFQALFVVLAIQQKLAAGTDHKNDQGTTAEHINLGRLKETKDNADYTRLLKVIEKEREMLAEFRTRETIRTEEMRVAKEAADEANREKSAFLAVVSHEIRTPMTGIMGMVRLLLDSNINKQQREYALTIQESSEAMLGLLNDILDFEKIQRGRIELENISFDLHRLIQGVITLMSGHAAQKGITLTARMDDNIPRFVKGDPTRLRQVILNLMGNAIKFTQEGSVTLMVRNLNEQEQGQPLNAGEKNMVYFAVQDTGIGISGEGQKNLFNPFSQANASISRKFGGSGLGLAICKGLIERMGSSINTNSKEGEGTTFFFTLLMEKGLAISGDQARKPAEEDRDVTPLNILIVDDNEINRKVIVGFLEKFNHTMTLSGDAEDALKKIAQETYDLVLMDIELPGMRGNEATKILRADKNTDKATIPVFAITGNIDSDDIARYRADGMNGFIAKPIDADKFNALVASVPRKSRERTIVAPGNDIQLMELSLDNLSLVEDDDEDTFAAALKPAAPAAEDHAIFNPHMLQSLKDTIGAPSLNELLSDLIVKTEEIVFAMEDAVSRGDLESLAARAHELKGMAGNFGLVEISSIAAQAEKKAKLSEKDGLDSLVNSLPDASIRAQAVLKEWVAH